jgi:hypothetical protein
VPSFSVSEHARILHVIIDARMKSARRLLSRPRDRDEFDREPSNPCNVHISPLFNDSSFSISFLIPYPMVLHLEMTQ